MGETAPKTKADLAVVKLELEKERQRKANEAAVAARTKASVSSELLEATGPRSGLSGSKVLAKTFDALRSRHCH